MKDKILRVIKPSPLVWLFLALLLAAQLAFCARLHVNEPSLIVAEYGIGGPPRSRIERVRDKAST